LWDDGALAAKGAFSVVFGHGREYLIVRYLLDRLGVPLDDLQHQRAFFLLLKERPDLFKVD